MKPATLLFVVNIPDIFVSHRLSIALAAKKPGYDVHVAGKRNWQFHLWDILIFQAWLEKNK